MFYYNKHITFPHVNNTQPHDLLTDYVLFVSPEHARSYFEGKQTQHKLKQVPDYIPRIVDKQHNAYQTDTFLVNPFFLYNTKQTLNIDHKCYSHSVFILLVYQLKFTH